MEANFSSQPLSPLQEPISPEISNTEEMELQIQPKEKVLLDKKIIGHIFSHLPKDELKQIRLVNSVWRSAGSAQMRQMQQGFHLITTSENLQKFVKFWNGRNDNIPYKNFTISLQHNYPTNILQLYWETISHVVTNLQISYGEAETSITSLDSHSNLNYPSLKDLNLSMHNIWKKESLATCKNLLFGLLQSSPNLEKFSVFVFGDYRSITLSEFFVDAMKTRYNKNLADLHIKGLDIVDHHFTSLAEIADLGLTQLSLDIPRFEDSKLSGEGLIKFLESQRDTLETLIIVDLPGVFDTCEFPKLENLGFLEVQKWTKPGRPDPNFVDEGIDYHKNLPNLGYLCFQLMGEHPYGIKKFLPRTDSRPITFLTSLKMELDGGLTESDAIEVLASFINLKWLNVPAWYRPLMEVYKTQSSLETLILSQDVNGVQALDKMLTGLEPREQLILRSIPGLLDKLTLNCENVRNTELVSIGCLKKLKRLVFRPTCGVWTLRSTMLPSLLTFKLVLTRMKSLEEIDLGNGRKLLLRDLPQDRPLLNSDIMKNTKGSIGAGILKCEQISISPTNKRTCLNYPPVPPLYSASPIEQRPLQSNLDSILADLMASQAARTRQLQEMFRRGPLSLDFSN